MKLSYNLNILACCFIFMGCAEHFPNQSSLKTDLGPSNAEIAARFKAYQNKTEHCSSQSSANRRVLLTGFGPFSGRDVNTTALVTENFLRLANNVEESHLLTPKLTKEDLDGTATQGEVIINHQKVAICTVTAAVVWDLAAAIFAEETRRFQPDFVIMMGMDGGNDYAATFEHHAENIASATSGYDYNGNRDHIAPVSRSPILKDGPDTIAMRWNGAALAQAADQIVKNFYPEFSVQTSELETPGEYICNNVAYAVLATISGHNLQLAGGLLQIPAVNLAQTKAGFLHLPWQWSNDAAATRTWNTVLLKTMEIQIGM